MNKGFEVFNIAEGTQVFELEKAVKVLTSKIPESSKKQRQVGNTTLTYIGGHTVIRLLNEAFNYQWSFEIVTEEIVESVPKPMFEGWGKNRKAVLNPDGSQKMEPQPPVAKVLGRLTVPGLGVKEQYGSKVLIGGATEQESAFKSASTDAMKKCASLFGIGLELYGEDEFNFDTETEAPSQPQVAPQQTQQQAPPVQEKTYTQTPPPVQQAAPQPPKQQAAPQGATSASQGTGQMSWDPADIQRMKDLKAIMGITDNNQLDPFAREFLDNPNVTWNHITPSNIKAFNIYLGKKAEAMQ
jgi:hypothetical protein